MTMTVLPRDPDVSWEAHLAGAVAGTLAAVLWRRLDPAAPEPSATYATEAQLMLWSSIVGTLLFAQPTL